jgi:uncharacterized protein YdeI (YjbR/CyaY-like superfamily)
MDSKQNLPIIAFASQREWEAWLAAQPAGAPGLWVKLAKKGTGIASITYAEAVEGALCYGWIDGQKSSFDERSWLQKFTPRGRRSRWSRVNRDKVLELERQGRLQPGGRAEVERAKQDGRWEAAYESQSRASVPDDFQRELEQNPAAQAFFAELDSSNRYAILYRIQDARKPETRARRIAEFIAMLNEGRKPHPLVGAARPKS